MKITIRRSGGFAGPMNARMATLETEDLPPARARRLEAYLETLAAEAESGQTGAAPGAADRRSYVVEIEAEGGRRSVRLGESAVPPRLRREWDEILDRPMP